MWLSDLCPVLVPVWGDDDNHPDNFEEVKDRRSWASDSFLIAAVIHYHQVGSLKKHTFVFLSRSKSNRPWYL